MEKVFVDITSDHILGRLLWPAGTCLHICESDTRIDPDGTE